MDDDFLVINSDTSDSEPYLPAMHNGFTLGPNLIVPSSDFLNHAEKLAFVWSLLI